MEVRILAPRTGRVARVMVKIGDALELGDIICVIAVDGEP